MNNKKYFENGGNLTKVRIGHFADPTHPKNHKGLLEPPYTVFHSNDIQNSNSTPPGYLLFLPTPHPYYFVLQSTPLRGPRKYFDGAIFFLLHFVPLVDLVLIEL